MRVDVKTLFFVASGLLGASCNAPFAPDHLQPGPGPAVHGETVREPEMLIQIGFSGEPQDARIACETCHSLREVKKIPEDAAALKEFHAGLTFDHGDLRCLSCHDEGQVPKLHLATGEAIDTRDALRLCAQCHGPQWRDFQHGAHGGMRGFWDTSRGGRMRNHCVDCHDPHAPAFVGGRPVLPPRDRFLPAPAAPHEGGAR